LPRYMERGIAVIAGGVFNSGVLAGGNTYDFEDLAADFVTRTRALEQTCARHQMALAAAAPPFTPRHRGMSTAFVGCRNQPYWSRTSTASRGEHHALSGEIEAGTARCAPRAPSGVCDLSLSHRAQTSEPSLWSWCSPN